MKGICKVNIDFLALLDEYAPLKKERKMTGYIVTEKQQSTNLLF